MDHPEADPAWREHTAHLLAWTAEKFGKDTGAERGMQWGATVMSEQGADMAKMGSHTARYGATSARWFEATGDRAARAVAARSLNWATYTCGVDGVVAVGQDAEQGWWFSDGYGDYIRHFIVAMSAVPEWAPRGENHLLRASSPVTDVQYAPRRVTYETFDADATETLRLVSRPASIEVAGQGLRERAELDSEGYVTRRLGGGGVVVRVRHRARGPVVITTSAAR
jgi:hypothetical protein